MSGGAPPQSASGLPKPASDPRASVLQAQQQAVAADRSAPSLQPQQAWDEHIRAIESHFYQQSAAVAAIPTQPILRQQQQAAAAAAAGTPAPSPPGQQRQQEAAAAAAAASPLFGQQPLFVPDPNNPVGFFVIYGYTPARVNAFTGFMEPALPASEMPPGACMAFVPNASMPREGEEKPFALLCTAVQQLAQAAAQPPYPNQQPAPAAPATAAAREKSDLDMTVMNEMRGKMKEEQKPRTMPSSPMEKVGVGMDDGMDRHHRPSGTILPLANQQENKDTSSTPRVAARMKRTESLLYPKRILSESFPQKKMARKEKEESGMRQKGRMSTGKKTKKRAAEAQPGGKTDRVQALQNELLKFYVFNVAIGSRQFGDYESMMKEVQRRDELCMEQYRKVFLPVKKENEEE
ncbi:hypothetical protein PENTCL1PPCAC_26141 [Pristionchus entomophagus]|uniref:Uncharacterized protein n=1 Tax=Pristionchus entomophagus TaxID=358040 RepID=A0AAV5UAZ0_9BILA|nr:hypothetical protein PENTCL1PPCAC_26141 [Pristionchus entomophagus]